MTGRSAIGPVIEAPATVRRAVASEPRAGAGASPPPWRPSATVASEGAEPVPPPRASGSGDPPPPPPRASEIGVPRPVPPAMTAGEDPKSDVGAFDVAMPAPAEL